MRHKNARTSATEWRIFPNHGSGATGLRSAAGECRPRARAKPCAPRSSAALSSLCFPFGLCYIFIMVGIRTLIRTRWSGSLLAACVACLLAFQALVASDGRRRKGLPRIRGARCCRRTLCQRQPPCRLWSASPHDRGSARAAFVLRLTLATGGSIGLELQPLRFRRTPCAFFCTSSRQLC